MFYIKVYNPEHPGAMPENLKQCKKCKVVSGDDWKQCRGRCTLPGSPHYDRATADYYGPPRELTRDEYLAELEAEADEEKGIYNEWCKGHGYDEIPF